MCNTRSKIFLLIPRINLGFMLLDSPKNAVFAQIFVFSNILVFLGVHWTWKWTKIVTFGCVPLHSKFKIFGRFFKSWFSLHETYLRWKFQQDWIIFGGLRAQTPPRKDHFMDAESVQKTLKILNLTTTDVILMKLTTIFLDKVSDLPKIYLVTHRR